MIFILVLVTRLSHIGVHVMLLLIVYVHNPDKEFSLETHPVSHHSRSEPTPIDWFRESWHKSCLISISLNPVPSLDGEHCHPIVFWICFENVECWTSTIFCENVCVDRGNHPGHGELLEEPLERSFRITSSCATSICRVP